jgi:uncharacterized protein (TIGR00369 family)
MAKYTDYKSMITDGILKVVVNPNCAEMMKQEFVEYVEGESLTYNYPVMEMYSNPRKSMQGGFISAAFDNTYGPFVVLVTGMISFTTLDLYVNYHKPIYEDDTLTVIASIKSQGKTIIHLVAEAFNKEKELIASSTSKIFLLPSEDEGPE